MPAYQDAARIILDTPRNAYRGEITWQYDRARELFYATGVDVTKELNHLRSLPIDRIKELAK